MADYKVGSAGGKDRYMVGWNGDNKSGYKVGGGGSSVGQASNKSLGGLGMDPVVGSKSAFSYKGEVDPKDIGDKSDNMNFGGSSGSGMPANKQAAGGEIQLVYSEKGDYMASKDAIARRKAIADAGKNYSGSKYDSPTVDLVNIKK